MIVARADDRNIGTRRARKPSAGRILDRHCFAEPKSDVPSRFRLDAAAAQRRVQLHLRPRIALKHDAGKVIETALGAPRCFAEPGVALFIRQVRHLERAVALEAAARIVVDSFARP